MAIGECGLWRMWVSLDCGRVENTEFVVLAVNSSACSHYIVLSSSSSLFILVKIRLLCSKMALYGKQM